VDIYKFPKSVSEQLKYYVYTLRDPRNRKVFYVGKGTGNRIFNHVSDANSRNKPKGLKLTTIRQIRAAGKKVGMHVVRHGLEKNEAFEVEAALIEHIGLTDLANEVAGHHANERGRMSVNDVIAAYNAKPIRIKEPALLIRVSRLFKRDMSDNQIYQATRRSWPVGPRRAKAEYAFSIFNGVVRAVYRIRSWRRSKARSPTQKKQDRWAFTADVATNLKHYIGGNVAQYLKHGAQNPLKYVNCERAPRYGVRVKKRVTR